MLSGKQVYPRTTQRKYRRADIYDSEERKGNRKLMNNEEKADVKNRESYVESGNHSHTDLSEFGKGLDNILIIE